MNLASVAAVAASLCFIVAFSIHRRRADHAQRTKIMQQRNHDIRKKRHLKKKAEGGALMTPTPPEVIPETAKLVKSLNSLRNSTPGQKKPVIRILSIDGGGIRGIIPARILAEFEKQTGKKIHELFHFIAGTSTGGVLAAGLAKKEPLSAADCVKLYADPTNGSRVFHASLPRQVLAKAGVLAKYDANSIEGILHEKFLNPSDKSRCKLSETLIPLLVTTYDLNSCEPYFFKSWKAQGMLLEDHAKREDYDFFLEDVVRATSAAPTYFDPKETSPFGHPANSLPKYRFVDGGVFANNPLACAYATIRSVVQDSANLEVISLGTGQQSPEPFYLMNGGWSGWAAPITSVMMDGSVDIVSYQMTHALRKEKFYRLEPFWNKEVQMDDVSPENVKFLLGKAEELISDDPGFQQVLELLKEPLSDIPNLLHCVVGQDDDVSFLN